MTSNIGPQPAAAGWLLVSLLLVCALRSAAAYANGPSPVYLGGLDARPVDVGAPRFLYEPASPPSKRDIARRYCLNRRVFSHRALEQVLGVEQQKTQLHLYQYNIGQLIYCLAGTVRSVFSGEGLSFPKECCFLDIVGFLDVCRGQARAASKQEAGHDHSAGSTTEKPDHSGEKSKGADADSKSHASTPTPAGHRSTSSKAPASSTKSPDKRNKKKKNRTRPPTGANDEEKL